MKKIETIFENQMLSKARRLLAKLLESLGKMIEWQNYSKSFCHKTFHHR
jgi:hypothetical protein